MILHGAGSDAFAVSWWQLEQLGQCRPGRVEPEQPAVELEHEHRCASRFSSRQMPGGHSARPVLREKGACSIPELKGKYITGRGGK